MVWVVAVTVLNGFATPDDSGADKRAGQPEIACQVYHFEVR
jgi:hypothetical protein